MNAVMSLPQARVFSAAMLLALAWMPQSLHAQARYEQTNLVSDVPGMATLTDSDLVNAWGLSFGASSPFWVSDNGTGKATLYSVTYDNTGAVQVAKQPLEVTIPGEGNPTGQLLNTTSDFNGDVFIFASEDGTISGWRPSLGTNAEVLASRSGAIYKGIALASTVNGSVLLAANFAEGTIDEYNSALGTPVQHVDPNAPTGYAPFNIQQVAGTYYVTYAKQDDQKHDDVKGRGHGLIDTYDPATGNFQRLITGSDAGGRFPFINSPWGIAIAPQSFGIHAGHLLVGNFGSGTIMTFDSSGRYRGLLIGPGGGPLVIDGLWGLRFGNDGSGGRSSTLYFSAGPNDESDGLFGSLDVLHGRR